MKEKEVDLTPHNIGQPNFYWEVEHDGKKGNNNSNYPTVKVKKNDGPHFIVFEIEGNNSITFPASNQISVKAGSKPSSGDTHPQIPTWRVADNGKQLWVFDWNDNDPAQALQLHYMLNFQGQGVKPLDPIIENGGGTIGGGEPPPPPPPPPPGPQGPGATAATESTQPSTPGLFGNIDAVSIVIGLVVGFLIALVLFRK